MRSRGECVALSSDTLLHRQTTSNKFRSVWQTLHLERRLSAPEYSGVVGGHPHCLRIAFSRKVSDSRQTLPRVKRKQTSHVNHSIRSPIVFSQQSSVSQVENLNKPKLSMETFYSLELLSATKTIESQSTMVQRLEPGSTERTITARRILFSNLNLNPQ